MKTFVCVNCGYEVRRPTPPLKCPACGQQRIGLFREQPAGTAPSAPARPVPPAGLPPAPGPVGVALAAPAASPLPSAPPIPGAPPPPLRAPSAPIASPPPGGSSTPPAPAARGGAGSFPAGPAPAVPAWNVSQPSDEDDGDEGDDIVDLEAIPGWIEARPSDLVPETLDEVPPASAVAAAKAAPPRPAPKPKSTPVAPRTVPAAPLPPAAATSAPVAAPAPVPSASEPPAPPDREEPAETAGKTASDKKVPGKPLWVWPKQIPGQPYSTAPVRCCPVLFGKTQFAACFGSKLVAFDWKNSGLEVLWQYDCVGHVPGSPVLDNDGLIRVHSSDGWLHCVDQGGAREWDPVPVGEPLGWAAPVVDADGNAYISAYGGGLLKVTARGNFKNTPFFRTRQKFDSTGVIYQGTLYIGSEDAYVYAIELGDETGRSLWDQLENCGKTDWFINSAPAITADGMIVVAGRDENLYGFHRDGKLAWKIHIPGQMLSSPLIGGNGDIYIGNSILRTNQKDRGSMVCVDGSSHRIRWEYDAKGAVESIPVIGDDDVLYFGDNAGYIHALRPDGHCLWTTHVRSAVRSAGMIVGPNRLVFGTDNGTLIGLLCSSGGVSRKGWAKYMAKNR